MSKLKEASVYHDSGDINLNGSVNKQHLRSTLACRAIDNPVAHVSESKTLVNHVLSLLFNLPPEHFFGYFDGDSVRKTRYYRARGKGVTGHTLGYVGTVEDHQKGTLHYHLIVFGSLTPFLLQRFASIGEVCKTISRVLDTMHRASLPSEAHVDHLIQRVAKNSRSLGLSTRDLNCRSHPALLGLATPLAGMQTEPFTTTHSVLAKLTLKQAGRLHYHVHHCTCKKGFNGKIGCRLNKKSGFCVGTHPVILKPICPTCRQHI